MKVCLAALIPLLACLLVLPSYVSGRRRIRQELEEKEDEYEISHIRKREYILNLFWGDKLTKSCEVCHRLYGINKAACLKGGYPPNNPCLQKAKLDQTRFESELNGSGSKAAEAPNKAVEKAPKAANKAAEKAPKAANKAAEKAPKTKNKAAEKAPKATNKADEKSKNAAKAKNVPKASSAASPDEKPERKLKLGSPDEYFKAPHLKRTCNVCSDIGGVVYENCVANTNDARKWCGFTIRDMRVRFNKGWDKAPAKQKKIIV